MSSGNIIGDIHIFHVEISSITVNSTSSGSFSLITSEITVH